MTGILDYLAIGVGPANLSLAAQADAVPGLTGLHLDRRDSFAWHPGLMLPDATLQVSPLKDLVTPVDPTSRFSFLAFLAAKGRFYQFLTARFPAVHRAEFNQYLAWAADQLDTVRFGHEVREVRFHDDHFEAVTGRDTFRARHLVLGTGQQPLVPAALEGTRGPSVFHSGEFLDHAAGLAGRRVAVVGGGQSGAEIVRHLLVGPGAPAQITWISRRPGFLPLDESAFTNDLYLPESAREFFGRPKARRATLLTEQKYASDGVNESLLADLYQQIYLATHVDERPDLIRLLTGHEVTGLTGSDTAGLRLALKSEESESVVECDAVVLATGYSQRLAPCLAPLTARLHLDEDGLPAVREDFSVDWDDPGGNRIYLQNGAQHAFGITDPNLSLLAWRSSVILDSIRTHGGTGR
ncbi:lysine N(6)-hydroxylase/L-ornithine N(5)-oxygenase family protein [Kitasatospora sp. NPDC088346]|uniref:lysine N(6)-hydroxylase/L-ornithine N(5)-oxygenase family protein n=1 Tax=Kitasatospora sp. NPDC088346 TaxID=3364073 RepID=UPI00380E01E1